MNLGIKLLRLSMKRFSILIKEKKDCYRWLKEDRIGVFLVKEYGSSLQFYRKKTKTLRDKKVIDRIALFMRNKDLIVGLQMTKSFG